MKITETILHKAEQYRDYTAQNLSQIIKIPSLSGEEEGVIAKLAQLLEDANFDEVRTDRLGNLIGRIGSGSRKLAFDAHIDTVDTGDLSQWEFDPFCGEIRDGKVLGRGTTDQKGGAASMITAGRILKELGYDGKFTIYFTFTIMEEDCDGLCWDYLITEEKLVPDFAVLTEPTNLGVYRGHRGRMELDIYFKGLSCHASAPERGINAIYDASRAALEIEKLDKKLASDEFLGKGTVAVTKIESESPSLCAVPDFCRIHLDRRLTWGETKDSAIAKIRKCLGKDAEVKVPSYSKSSYRGTVHPQELYFPTWKIPKSHPLVIAGIKSAQLALNNEPVVDKWTFSTNGVALCGKHRIPCIGFGPGNEIQAHAPNETVPLEHLVKAADFYALLPYMLEKHN